MAPHKGLIVEFGKYKYLWGFDSGLCLVKTGSENKKTFSDRGLINSNGEEIIKPYTFTDIFDFYGKKRSTIKVENGDVYLFLDKNNVSRVVRRVSSVRL